MQRPADVSIISAGTWHRETVEQVDGAGEKDQWSSEDDGERQVEAGEELGHEDDLGGCNDEIDDQKIADKGIER